MALILSNVLFGGLLLFAAYFFIVMVAFLTMQELSKDLQSGIRISSSHVLKIIEYFEKFIF
jgi:hypothetical protein